MREGEEERERPIPIDVPDILFIPTIPAFSTTHPADNSGWWCLAVFVAKCTDERLVSLTLQFVKVNDLLNVDERKSNSSDNRKCKL